MEFIILAIVSAFAGTLADNVINSATSTGGTNMLGGLPVEMITMLGSSVLGGVMSIWSQSIKAKEHKNALRSLSGFFFSALARAKKFGHFLP